MPMDTPIHSSSLAPDPGVSVRTNLALPEDLHHTASLLARRRRCSLWDVAAEGLRMLFASIEATEAGVRPQGKAA